jgi:hypothetical protein
MDVLWEENRTSAREVRRRKRKKSAPVRIVHLVKLVDQAHSLVRQHQRTTLQRPLTRHRILPHARRQTDRTSSLTRRKHSSVRRLLDVLQELRLGCSGVTEEEDVDITTDAMLAVDVLRNTAEEGESDGSLNVVVTVDRGRHRLDDTFADALIASERADGFLVVFG